MLRSRTVRCWILAVVACLALAACDDDDPLDGLDVADTNTDTATETTGDLEPDSSTSDTSTQPDTAPDLVVDTSDTQTTTSVDIQIDIDYDASDSLAPDTDDVTGDTTTDLADTTIDAMDVADTADTTDATVEDTTDTADMSGPQTDFDDLAHLRDAALRAALLDRIDEHTALGYDGARDAMYDAASGIDVDGGLIECVYTGKTAVPNGTNTPGGTHNTEHTWPQSQGADTEPARSDLHHLFPATQNANSVRGNTRYGDTACDQSASCSWFDSGSELGASTLDGASVFEVRPLRRGDIARAHFYFSVRYALPIEAVTEQALRQWSADDPPDDFERDRNDAIELLQSNRNPFVDRPDFVDFISDF